MRLQFKALRLAMGFRNSTPMNVILAEAKEPPLNIRRDYLCRNFLTKMYSNNNHPLIPILESIVELEDNPTVVNRFMDIPLIHNFRMVYNRAHIIANHPIPIGYITHFDSLILSKCMCVYRRKFG